MKKIRRLIAANWKMNNLATRANELVQAIDVHSKSIINNKCDVLICPSAVLLQMISNQLKNSFIDVGAQDCHFEEKGAFTGEISAKMLADVGASYVILGHSERRHGLSESDNLVRAKVKAAHKESLIAIICIGETDVQKGDGETLNILKSQIRGSLPEIKNQIKSSNTIFAYEPVWAIGTGKTPTLSEISDVHGQVRNFLINEIGSEASMMKILYGGSMNTGNALSILNIDNVDGGLIGGASLNEGDFCKIIDLANE
ncbi:MAG: triose-phosphate isomerase [Alphaproteobacteria bacterium]|nr:triose-phosphate isomerase [Alphaproteobacteria bacterium]PPR12687.1 MAG: Triosephosphate isomerase [Alphaproteobacteria bacterium MarineAlpha12_Bin1]